MGCCCSTPAQDSAGAPPVALLMLDDIRESMSLPASTPREQDMVDKATARAEAHMEFIRSSTSVKPGFLRSSSNPSAGEDADRAAVTVTLRRASAKTPMGVTIDFLEGGIIEVRTVISGGGAMRGSSPPPPSTNIHPG